MNTTAPITNSGAPRINARYRNELFETAAERYTAFLDAAVPLSTGSHQDVVEYCVDVPMRYAECFAILKDGRKVPLANKRSFVAWTGHAPRCAMVFEVHGLRIEARINSSDRAAGLTPGRIAGIDVQPIKRDAGLLSRPKPASGQRFIAVDGALFA
ncbi:MAG TPA: hypothetical protein PKH39_06680 [Woeseiaceae bacterium]|nr:hypothetical protein [Woeseiaceae bacterium]